MGFQMPMSLLQSGSIGSISYEGKSVNLRGEKFSDVVSVGASTETGTRKFSASAQQAENDQTETVAFKDWFGDWKNHPESASKVVNADGTPKVMYRGGNETFNIFDRKKSKYSNLYGRGFYFTDSESHAKQYGDVRAYYLDVKNPVSMNEKTITRKQLRTFLKAVAENEDYGLENYGYGATVDSVLRSVYGKNDFAMLYDVNQTAIGDMVAAVEIPQSIVHTRQTGFFGCVVNRCRTVARQSVICDQKGLARSAPVVI